MEPVTRATYFFPAGVQSEMAEVTEANSIYGCFYRNHAWLGGGVLFLGWLTYYLMREKRRRQRRKELEMVAQALAEPEQDDEEPWLPRPDDFPLSLEDLDGCFAVFGSEGKNPIEPESSSGCATLTVAPSQHPLQTKRPNQKISNAPKTSSFRNRFAKAWLVSFTLLAASLFLAPAWLPGPSLIHRTKNIEDVVAGDMVMSRDEQSGEMVPRRVLRTFRNVSDHLRVLQIQGADGTTQELHTTDGHPFWVEGRGWVDAGELLPGVSFHQSDGQPAMLVGSEYEPHPEGVLIFNFEVEARIDQLLRRLYGPRGERFDPNQPFLFAELLRTASGVSNQDVKMLARNTLKVQGA